MRVCIGEHGIGEHEIGEYGIGEHGIGEHGIGEYGISEMLRHPAIWLGQYDRRQCSIYPFKICKRSCNGPLVA